MNIQNRMDSSLMMDRAVRKRDRSCVPIRNPTGYPARVRITVNYMIN